MPTAPSLTVQIRSFIADALYPTSANQLPFVCERFGLAPGTVQDAFASKRTYVLNRVNRFPLEKLVEVGREILAEYPHYELEEAIAKADDARRHTVSELIRRRIMNALNHVDLSGRIGLFEFIGELWPISKMNSKLTDGNTIEDDMYRHMIRNNDWLNEEFLEYLGTHNCSQSRLFAFLEAIVHPRTRDESEQRQIVELLNPLLRRDGFALVQTGRVSGYPIFTVCHVEGAQQRADAAISSALAEFDPDSVHAAWTKALDRRVSDPEGAITLARTLLETVCKHIIEDAGGTYGEKDDLPKLYRTAAVYLNLAPDQHTEEAFRTILGNCQKIVETLGSLRNRLSDAHGRGRKPVRPQPRHAELAVNLAGTVATFLVSTWRSRNRSAP